MSDPFSFIALKVKSGGGGLPAGIHLRWMPEPGSSFPAYGFYLFRRLENMAAGPFLGWTPIDNGFQYPLALPFAEDSYPCLSKPQDKMAAWELAQQRVTYNLENDWNSNPAFDSLYALIGKLFESGKDSEIGTETGGDHEERFAASSLGPLDTLLLGSLQPAVAQQLGLYFVDTTAMPTESYEYLLMADFGGVLGGTAASALDWLGHWPAASAEERAKASFQLPAPYSYDSPWPSLPEGSLNAYSLPSRPPGAAGVQPAGSIGLSWQEHAAMEWVASDSLREIVFFLVYRLELKEKEPIAEPPTGAYSRIATVLQNVPEPPAVPDPKYAPPERISGWPPLGIPLLFLDLDLEQGWYSYRLVGQDIFGRRSSLGPPSQWLQWQPEPAEAKPWYYVNSPSNLVNPYAVRLLEKIPPPTPAGFEAWALDPLDRWLFRDAAYEGWLSRVGPGRVGLRIRWLWTSLHQRQAPDTREFRLYHRPGRAAEAGMARDWPRRLAVFPYRPNGPDLQVEEVFLISLDAQGRKLTSDQGSSFESVQIELSGTLCRFKAIAGAGPELASLQPEFDQLWLKGTAGQEETLAIKAVHAVNLELTLAAMVPPEFTSPAAWAIGRPAREYQAFLEAPFAESGQSFEPNLESPTVYAQLALSAADNKSHTLDDPKWDPPRRGNEGSLCLPATVFRVLQVPPKAPQLPQLPERRWATPANHQDRSYSTFRFKVPQGPLRVHILRALDESLFTRDWLLRETRSSLDPANVRHNGFFPRSMAQLEQEKAAKALNELVTKPGYQNLSEEAWAVLARLPGNENVAAPDASQEERRKLLEERDWPIRRSRRALVATGDGDLFPDTWNEATREAAVDELEATASAGSYAALSDNGRRLLAALPGNEAAFVQVTLKSVPMDDPDLRDQRRPDDPLDYVPKSDLRGYLDALPGRGTNAYFYRARFVDGAQNQSSLSLPGPPVYLPDSTPPDPPVVLSVLGGERKIKLRWAPSREPAGVATWIYRTGLVEQIGDLRLLGDPVKRLDSGSDNEWVDEGVEAGSTFFYVLVHVKTTQIRDQMRAIRSAPSKVATGRAFDTQPPAPAQWVRAELVEIDASGVATLPQVSLKWSSDPGSTSIVERKAEGAIVWQGIATLTNTGQEYSDENLEEGTLYQYRIKSRKLNGRLATSAPSLPLGY